MKTDIHLHMYVPDLVCLSQPAQLGATKPLGDEEIRGQYYGHLIMLIKNMLSFNMNLDPCS